jgi:hypothetical protein
MGERSAEKAPPWRTGFEKSVRKNTGNDESEILLETETPVCRLRLIGASFDDDTETHSQFGNSNFGWTFCK